ncbi:MAG: PHP domain-containing protein [Calditrichia bacterium]|nr:PHP domain-containing protein [Calditrichia bacterium]
MIDLHTHSTFSDGSLTPEQLVKEAVKCNLSAIALTDHDTVSGIPNFLKACKKHRIKGIPGIEFSVNDELSGGGQVHLIGLFIDHHSTVINKYAKAMKQHRIERNRKIVEKLNQAGIVITAKDVENENADGVLGRVHIAKALIKKRMISSVQEAFDTLIGPGKPAFVPKPRFQAEEIINMIHQANGIAILAHPLYLNFASNKITPFINELVKYGLDGVEVFYPNTPKKIVHTLLKIVEEKKLLISGGSDYHGKPIRPEVNLGTGRGDIYIPDNLLKEMEEYRNKR